MAPVLAGGGILFLRYLPQKGLLGHDYSHYFARLLIGADHFWKNGWKVPHFTPYLCGGVPFYADPQQIYYSLPQFLSFFSEVLPATYFSFTVFYALGYWGMWKLCQEDFHFGKNTSHFVSLLFFLNGFSYSHLLVGHITHLPFLLAPWLLHFFLRGKVALFALTVLYCVYSGSLHVLVVFLGVLALFLPFYLKEKGSEKFLKFSFWALFTILLGASGKLFAALRYSPYFFMHEVDSSGLSALQLFKRYFWFDPFHTPHHLNFRYWFYGAWEYTASISRLTLVLSFLGVLVLVWKVRREGKLLLGVGLVTSLIFLLSLGTSFNSNLPFFSHYHNPLKLLAAFLLPLLLLSGVALEALSKEIKIKEGVFLLLSVFVVLEFFVSSEFLTRVPNVFSFSYPGAEFREIFRRGGLPPVTHVIGGERNDYASMKLGRTSLSCYEPLFGYQLEKLKPSLKVGDGGLNHPGCLLYSKELGCEPWSRISNPIEEEKFRVGKSMETWVPTLQTFWNVLSLLTCISLLMSLNEKVLTWCITTLKVPVLFRNNPKS